MKLNAAQLAAIATGASPEAIAALATAPEANPPGNPVAADPAAAPGADDAAAVAAAAAAAAGAATPTAPPGTPDNPAGTAAEHPSASAAVQPNELVNHLKAELGTAQAALIAAKVEAETFKAQAAAVDGLVNTLRAALGEKLVALGASADAAAGYSAANIVAEYSRIDAVFKTQFRVGGVAAVASPEPKDTKAAVDPMLAEALKYSLIK